MKTTLIIGIILSFFFVKSLLKIGSKGFEIKQGKVYFYQPVNGVPFVYDSYEIEAADASTFKVINFPYAKDAQHVFFNKGIIKDCDPNSFELLSHESGYSRDKNHTYYFYTKLSDDPNNFALLGDRLAKDETKVYWKNESIENADPITFENLGNGYSKNKSRVFYEKNNKLIVVEGASPENFQLDTEDPAKGIYGEKLIHEGKLVSRAKDSFQKIDDDYSMDEVQVFYNMQPLKNSDPKTFQVLKNYFSKDAKQVYFLSYPLPNANPASFKVLEESFSHDDENLYHRSRKIEGGDFATLKIFGSRWAKDKNHVYLNGYVKEDLDATTFQELKGGYVKDANSVYHFESKVKKADAATFRTEGEYPNVKAFDKNHRYVGHSAKDM